MKMRRHFWSIDRCLFCIKKAKKPNSDKVAMKLGLPVGSASSTKKVECPTPPQFLNIPEHPTPPPEPHLSSRLSWQDETGELPPETETWNTDNWDEEWLSSPWNNHKNWWSHEHAHEQRQDRQEGEAPGDPRHVIHQRGINSLLHSTGLPPSRQDAWSKEADSSRTRGFQWWQVAWSKEADSSRTRGFQWWTDSGPRSLSRQGSRKRERTSNQRARARSRTTTWDNYYNYSYDYFWIRNNRRGTTTDEPERLTEDSRIQNCGTVLVTTAQICFLLFMLYHTLCYPASHVNHTQRRTITIEIQRSIYFNFSSSQNHLYIITLL